MTTGHVAQSWSGEPAVGHRMAEASQACRALFGTNDPEENLQFVREEMKKINYLDKSRWNFDFKNETSLSGRYQWHKLEDKHSIRHFIYQRGAYLQALHSDIQAQDTVSTGTPDKINIILSDSICQNIVPLAGSDLKNEARQMRITDYMKKCKQPQTHIRNSDPDMSVTMGNKFPRRISS
ncbi:uncharacterized protein LOC143225488 [Tachypleus tridentatus]|uniref:uncharacterized protein LOC143225488 n=1 Tax=Tachypleus tridentatus TaxID=6853 RepID=UPI003FD53A90